jgi:hypothetical protein
MSRRQSVTLHLVRSWPLVVLAVLLVLVVVIWNGLEIGVQ